MPVPDWVNGELLKRLFILQNPKPGQVTWMYSGAARKMEWTG